jgi:hypothetical protein
MTTLGTKKRAKAGMGRTPFGISADTAKRLSAIRADTSADFHLHLRSLYQFTQSFMDHARDLAKSGYKDEARNWWRYFSSSRVINLLKTFPAAGDCAVLEKSLKLLQLECHPADVPSWTTDIEAIRFCLSSILSHVENKTQVSGSDGRTHRRRPIGRCDGHASNRPKNFESV